MPTSATHFPKKFVGISVPETGVKQLWPDATGGSVCGFGAHFGEVSLRFFLEQANQLGASVLG